MRGRKPKPTALKLLQGTARKHRMNAAEPKPRKAVVRCPAWLNAAEKRHWARLHKELVAMRVFTPADADSLADMAVLTERTIAAKKAIDTAGLVVKSPSGFPVQNPYIGVYNAAMKQLVDLRARFGLTPSDRTRIRAIPEAASGADDLKAFARKKG